MCKTINATRTNKMRDGGHCALYYYYYLLWFVLFALCSFLLLLFFVLFVFSLLLPLLGLFDYFVCYVLLLWSSYSLSFLFCLNFSVFFFLFTFSSDSFFLSSVYSTRIICLDTNRKHFNIHTISCELLCCCSFCVLCHMYALPVQSQSANNYIVFIWLFEFDLMCWIVMATCMRWQMALADK